jgi:Tfp pilus assembly ATPase PilU
MRNGEFAMEPEDIHKLTRDFEQLRECYMQWLDHNLYELAEEGSITHHEYQHVLFDAYDYTTDPEDFVDFIRLKHELDSVDEILQFLSRFLKCME